VAVELAEEERNFFTMPRQICQFRRRRQKFHQSRGQSGGGADLRN